MSRVRWPRALLSGFGALFLSVATFANSMGAILASQDSPLAIRFDPWNPAALAGQTLDQAQAVLGGSARPGDAVQTALAALRQGPIQASSMRAVAVASAAAGKERVARRQLDIAERLSRRDQGTQFALIELCVAAADVKCALRHYDIALTTSQQPEAALAPILVRALSSPEIRAGLIPYIRADRVWIIPFLAQALSMDADPANIAEMLIASRGLARTPAGHEIEGLTFSGLEARGDWRTMQRLYDAVEAPAKAAAPILSFVDALIDIRRQPIAWRPVAGIEGSAAFERAGPNTNMLRVVGSFEQPTPVARKVMFLNAGSFRLQAQLSRTPGAANGQMAWRLHCSAGIRDGAVLGEQPLHPIDNTIVRWEFRIRDDCPVQRIELLIMGDGRQGETNVVVHSPILRAY